MNQAARVWALVVYSILYEAIVWGVFCYGVFLKNHSAWWFLAALLVSGCQLKGKHFGIYGASDD